MISEKVQKTLDMVENKELTSVQLNNLYNNVQKYEAITDEEREAVIAAVEAKIKVVDPRKAKRLFGPKDAQARVMMEEAYAAISEEFDLTANVLKNGVKTGGDMIAGRKYIDVYLSYKNTDNWNFGFGYNQDTVDELPYLRTRLYQTGGKQEETMEVHNYSVEEFSEALSAYKDKLKTLI